ncbi:ABC transporter substrate-binding protein [Nonomuraea roseoviolacea]|uniref:Multiple sugar transport system substrate-binding protein n=1 Tax=Nonomuraea roseoviolacea subsp. carminata TaxID=160689 RepID=A0ABT1JRN7_9ACTN|nr:extracellular solute-binding protein [Nonomuraea roseoviolacea]MCP2343956.1 multiple sugar transport system substrate-binding protein [Nonomuraea roseoviolacea subsp. carminata]
MVAITVTGCSGGSPPSAPSTARGKQKVSFLVFPSPNLPESYWKAQVELVTKAHPDLEVELVAAPSESERNDYAKQLAASGQLPDVQIGMQDLVALEPSLAPWSEQELTDFLCPTCGAVNGKVVQLPANTQTIPDVFYNKKLFAKAGVTAPPKTYAELVAAAEKLKAAGITPFVSGGVFVTSQPWTAILATDLYARTPDWIARRRKGEVTFAGSPEMKAATQKFADLAAKGYVDKRQIGQDYPKTQEAFLAGKGAMYPMGSWFAAAADQSDIKDDIGVFAWPSDAGTLHLPAFTGGGLSVSATAKNLAAAKEFALAFQLTKENLDASVKADALFPAIKGYTPPPDTGPVFKAVYDLWRQALDRNATVPAFGWEAGDAAMPPGMQGKFWSAAQDLVSGRKTVDQVLSFLDTEWEKSG